MSEESDEKQSMHVLGNRRTNARQPLTVVDSSSLARRRPLRQNNSAVESSTGKNGFENVRNATFSSFRSIEKATSGGSCNDDRWQHKEPVPEITNAKANVALSVTVRRPLPPGCLSGINAEAQGTAGTPVISQTPIVSTGSPVVAAVTHNESSLNSDRVIVVDGGSICDRIDRILMLHKNIRSSNV